MKTKKGAGVEQEQIHQPQEQHKFVQLRLVQNSNFQIMPKSMHGSRKFITLDFYLLFHFLSNTGPTYTKDSN